MTMNIKNHEKKNSIWKRAFAFIKAYEEASEYTPAEHAIIQLNRKVSKMEGAIRSFNHQAH
jgi:hypothetical protein